MITINSYIAGIQNNPAGQRYVAAMGMDGVTLPSCTLISTDPLFYQNQPEVIHA